ncbi:hypothetical protein Xen7305DRAFT_00046670 [Xenococcus sp. PCC 7305]|uniref:hypothetical protein n=1 Tax=Xenococcus sp. PCC 7305 TaxID=102125 RepID=UPI0002AD0D7D|nr:hypothetical protein [Xenococcus sp. PCC 7305]ELS04931.1 hypothetical protein Xen7305DRAFT_00046670 [Xenococcus sp. PCC 7305]
MKFLVLATSRRGNQHVEKLINLEHVVNIDIGNQKRKGQIKTIHNQTIILNSQQCEELCDFLKSEDIYSSSFAHL